MASRKLAEPIIYNIANDRAEFSPPFLLSILNASPDCIKLIEVDGTVLFMNENGRKLLELDEGQSLAGKIWWECYSGAAATEVKKAVELAIQGQFSRFEAPCPTSKGRPAWWEVSVGPVMDENGRPVQIVAISRDITARIQAEQELREKEAELERLAYRQREQMKHLETQLDECCGMKTCP